MYKRINEPLLKNGVALFEIGDTSNEILGDASNWEKVKKSVWDLKEEDIYYFIDDDGTVGECVWFDDKYDNRRLSIGNVYLTKEVAEEDSWRMYFETKMRKEFKPEECDWEDVGSSKHYIIHDRYVNKLSCLSTCYSQHQGVIHCNNEKVVEQFIKDNKEDLIRYFKGV